MVPVPEMILRIVPVEMPPFCLSSAMKKSSWVVASRLMVSSVSFDREDFDNLWLCFSPMRNLFEFLGEIIDKKKEELLN